MGTFDLSLTDARQQMLFMNTSVLQCMSHRYERKNYSPKCTINSVFYSYLSHPFLTLHLNFYLYFFFISCFFLMPLLVSQHRTELIWEEKATVAARACHCGSLCPYWPQRGFFWDIFSESEAVWGNLNIHTAGQNGKNEMTERFYSCDFRTLHCLFMVLQRFNRVIFSFARWWCSDISSIILMLKGGCSCEWAFFKWCEIDR